MRLIESLKGKAGALSEDEDGFTLIELVIVVAIIGILSAIALPTFGSIQETSRVASGETTAKNTYAALVSVDKGLELELSKAEVLASANQNSGDLLVTVNDGWTSESDLCVTATWVNIPDSDPNKTQNYGPGCS